MTESKTSTTAFGVACGMWSLARLPEWRGKFSEEETALYRGFVQHAQDSLLKRLAAWMPPRVYVAMLDRLFIPGMCHHYLFRKHWVERTVKAGFDEGVQQVVVLGGGFDTLALRLSARHPSVRFWEIDLPATQAQKCAALAMEKVAIPANLCFAAADLSRTTLPEAMGAQEGFDRNFSTFIVIEGVLMYLTEQEVKALFTTLREMFGVGLRVVFGATTVSDDAGCSCLRLFNTLLLKKEAANKWYCPGSEMVEFLQRLGYELREWKSYKNLQREHRREAEIARIPEEDENYYFAQTVA